MDADAALPPDGSSDVASAADGGPSEETIDLRHPVILVVDDDPVLGRVVEACLDYEGAEVRVAHTLAEARGALADDLDHIVLDRMLPDGDGLELLDEVSARCPNASVVILTAYDHLDGPDHLPTVDKADIANLCDVLGLEQRGEEPTIEPLAPPLPEPVVVLPA